jgi:chromosome segregation ATPase
MEGCAVMADEVERCSCDEALALRVELAEARAQAEAATARAQEFENHWHNACDVGRRLDKQLEQARTSLTIAESRIRELLPLRAGMGRLAKQVTELRRELKRARECLSGREPIAADATTH